MTSFAETHPQIREVLGGPLSLHAIKKTVLQFFRRLRIRCGEGCSSGGSGGGGGGGSGGVQCADVEISLENLRSNLMSSVGQGLGAGGTTAAAANRGFPGSSAGASFGPMGLGTYAALSATGGGLPFGLNAARGSSPRSSLGTQRGSIASTMSGTLRKPSGSTLISLAGMLAERDSSSVTTTTTVASTAGSANPMGSGTLNTSAPSVRERRSSRATESQEREREARLRRNAAESGGTSARPKSSSGRLCEEDRRGVRERSRRRERDRRDRFERLDLEPERALYETDTETQKIGQRAKVFVLEIN